MIHVATIKAAVCRHYSIPPIDLVSARRDRPTARPRQIAMALARQLTRQSLPSIGRMFGGRDHATVIHAVRTIDRLYASDPALRRSVDSLSVALLIHPVLI